MLKASCGFFWIFLFTLATLGEMCRAEEALITVNSAYSCSVQLPDDFVIKRTDGEDFRVYTVFHGSDAYLGIYVGTHPNFPAEKVEKSKVTILDFRLHALSQDESEYHKAGNSVSDIQILSWWKDGRLTHRELLAYLRNTDNVWIPTYVHAWIPSSLPESKIATADQILFSVKVRPGK